MNWQTRKPTPQHTTAHHSTPQCHFVSTKMTTKKHTAEATLSKPDEKEKVFLFESLTGNVEMVFLSAANSDNDYHVTPDDHVAFEHSY